MNDERIVKEILSKIPRPNYEEIPALYIELDDMTKRIAKVLLSSRIYDRETETVRFEKATPEDIYNLIAEDPDVMIPFFVMICGFSVRELERLSKISDIYALRDKSKFRTKKVIARRFAEVVKDNLHHSLYLETVLYKFYKNWEEHQKRHYRAKIEDKVRKFFRDHGYDCGKIKIHCKDKDIEVDGAIPPDPKKVKVVFQIRTGVRRDLVKRAKEFSSEFDTILQCYPHIKFVVVYLVSPHERDRLEEIRRIIVGERKEKRPYDAVILTWEELEDLLKKFKEWKI